MKFKVIFIFMILVLIFPVCKKDKKADKKDIVVNEEIEVTYEGYLMDAMCGIPGVGLDGTDLKNSPQDHTKHCLEYCVESGYGIYIKEADEYKFIEFDQNGHELAVELLKNSKKDNTFLIKVEGILKDDVLTVELLNEK